MVRVQRGRLSLGKMPHTMTKILMNTRVIDVEYLGMPQYIACCLLEGESPAIIDPGPTVSLGKLEEGLQQAVSYTHLTLPTNREV